MKTGIASVFAESVQNPSRRREIATPFCIRLTPSERRKLRDWAGRKSLSSYIRARLFGEDAAPRRKQRPPQRDEQALARLLHALGQSRLSQNMNQLAKLANNGALPLDETVTADLVQACEDIRVMRHALVAALNVVPED